MRLIGREKLLPLQSCDRATAKWVVNWTAEIRDAHWKRASDVIDQFPRTLHQADGTFLFLLPQREVGIQVLMVFPRGVALIVEIKTLEAANEY
ncbi:MAG: hypothetical protein SFV19_04070 [Rhodospirillaceae bacterium]|nr:hypothetical protein [Rhodospirillaceae bacterium]